ncbi:aldose epimerase family protein [Dawidia soli]|uniref:Aldose 1-epimerase n=1 Tax=Dawidia soli TaxID=2782352 RepID=A0AAP2GFT9_9BACT|nr:aldose epimerase family protein [Dawidia soli]MBT1685431.1 galactose mutarotase [Dawidia soli]
MSEVNPITITQTPWGTHRGEPVFLFRLTNAHGSSVEVTNYGATLVSVVVPDRAGRQEPVVLGFPSLEGYLRDRCYLGSTVGRYANRIARARFALDGKVYPLEANDGVNTNHGGRAGFHARVFAWEQHSNGVSFTYTSPTGDGGYPGTLTLRVAYTWSDDQALTITYTAVTDQKTVANFTNHAYFNLAAQGTMLDHTLSVRSSHILAATPAYIPTGEIIAAGTRQLQQSTVRQKVAPMDGRQEGLNDYYILDKAIPENEPVAVLYDPASGRQMDVFTSYPGLMVYTADYLVSEQPGHIGALYKPFDGICLECQYYPDSPNHAHFPDTTLAAGEEYREWIVFKFSTQAQ